MKSDFIIMNKDKILDQLCEEYPSLRGVREDIASLALAMISCFESGGKLLICGNGGSCADSEHIVGELMKSFELPRPLSEETGHKLREISPDRGDYIAGKLQQGFPAYALAAQTALATAICNDIDPDLVFAQQVLTYGRTGDILLGISTSGNSQNVIDALIAARAIDMVTAGVSGRSGGRMKEHCDIIIKVPEERTARIQELQLPVMHTICRLVENHFFNK